jgi:hypothetical protein
VVIDRGDPRGSKYHRTTLYRGMEEDDHNNPSVVFFHSRLYAFSAPHSGHVYPRNRRMFVRYRVSRGEGGTRGYARSRSVPIVPVAGGRMYLFVRGPCWKPYFTSTVDGIHWTHWRTLFNGPRNMRPYAKYSSGPDGSVHMAFSDAHPSSYRTSLYYLRMRRGRLYRADGHRIGSIGSLPLRLGKLDLVAPYTRRAGRAWPEDIAVEKGHPVVVYSSTIRHRGVFDYAWWSGTRWRRSHIVRAGRATPGYRNGGVSLNHAHPSWLVLVRAIRGHN